MPWLAITYQNRNRILKKFGQNWKLNRDRKTVKNVIIVDIKNRGKNCTKSELQKLRLISKKGLTGKENIFFKNW